MNSRNRALSLDWTLSDLVIAGAVVGDRGGRAGDRDELVGRQPDAEMRTEVGVEVDETGGDELSAGIDPLQRAVGGDAGRDGRDLPVFDSDVTLAPQLLARVQHVTVGDKRARTSALGPPG